MSSFITDLKVNNLTKKLNALSSEVQALVIGGAPVIEGDLDMNSHSINEIYNLSFTGGADLTIDNGNLQYDSDTLISQSALTDTIGPYQKQISENNFDLNNHYITNTIAIQMIDAQDNTLPLRNFLTFNGNLVSSNYADVRQYLFTNQTGSEPHFLDIAGQQLDRVGAVQFTDSSILTSSDSNLYYNNNEIATYNLSNDINGQNNYGLRQLDGINLKSGASIEFTSANELGVLSSDLIYNGSIIITQANFGNYLPAGNFIPTANQDLNMSNYNIDNCGTLDCQAVAPTAINFGGQVSQKLTVLGGDLKYQSTDVITAANISSYITLPSTATQDLNMANFNIDNAGTLDCQAVNPTAINFGGQVSQKLTVLGGVLKYANNEVLTRNNLPNDIFLVRGTATPTTPFTYTIPNDGSDSSYYIKGEALGLVFGISFTCFIRYSPELIATIYPVSITQLADISEDTFNNFTITFDSNNNFLITLSVNNNVLSENYESVCVNYQIIQCSFQEL